ncbi:hypothetical protein ACFW16_27885 [Inquilinus sp. NPDC058860]|uniref:hypothetical protein n=1 Tax=Inquilinus sp. NPDC058860 TaxID=3346652 RepID=UPI0036935BD7
MDLDWWRIVLRELASSQRVLVGLVFLGWLIGAGGIVGAGAIDNMARHAPSVADAVYRYPYQFKGQLRFLNDWQQQVEAISRIMMPAGLAIFVAAGAAEFRRRHRESDERSQRVLRGSGRTELG